MRPAALLFLAAGALFVGMDAIVKLLAERYPTFQIVCLRFAVGAIITTAICAFMRPRWPSREAMLFNTTRSVLVAMTATAFFFALGKLPLGDAIALSFLSPIFLAIFAAVLLKERIEPRIPIALVVGFAGVLLVVGSGFGQGTYGPDAPHGVAAILFWAIAYALVLIVLRLRAQVDALLVIVWFQNAVPAVLLAVPASYVWRDVTGADLMLFGVLGTCGVAGHLLMAAAFARAPASELAPLEYASLLWALLLGLGVFGEVPTLAMLAGSALIIAATLVSQRRTSEPAASRLRDDTKPG